MCERDLMNGNLLCVKSAQDFEERPAAVRGVRAHAFVEDRRATHTGDRARDFESPVATLLERLVASDPDRDDVRADRGLQLRRTSLADDCTKFDDPATPAELLPPLHVLGSEA